MDADDLEAVKVMLRGSKRRFQETGHPPIFIHTVCCVVFGRIGVYPHSNNHQSGTGVLTDDAAGLRASDTVWDDANPEQLDRLPPTAPHRDVDLELIHADDEGYVRVYIVAPATIYGLASGKFVDAGIANKHSIQLPSLIHASLDRGRAGMVGAGVNIWPNVHIDDGGFLVSFNLL